MPNIRRIYDVDYYSVKKNTVNYCIQCGNKILINTSAYAKDSKNSSQLVCRECIMILTDQFQYEKYGRIPFPKEEPLYVGLVRHTCSTLNHSDFVTKTAIFRRKNDPQLYQYLIVSNATDSLLNSKISKSTTIFYTTTSYITQ